jgi:hypothetical protein
MAPLARRNSGEKNFKTVEIHVFSQQFKLSSPLYLLHYSQLLNFYSVSCFARLCASALRQPEHLPRFFFFKVKYMNDHYTCQHVSI